MIRFFYLYPNLICAGMITSIFVVLFALIVVSSYRMKEGAEFQMLKEPCRFFFNEVPLTLFNHISAVVLKPTPTSVRFVRYP